MDAGIIAAIITASATIIAAIIAGCFSLIKKKKAYDSGINITQTQSGDNNMQIGIQENYIDTTVEMDLDVVNGSGCVNETLIIDSGKTSDDGDDTRLEY